MLEYGGTLPEVIASHVRPLAQKVQKEGVWEDTRMLTVRRPVRAMQGEANRVKPPYG